MKKSLTREIVDVFGTNISIIVISFISGIILSRILGPENKGIFIFVLVLPTIIRTFCELGVRQSTMFYLGKNLFDEKLFLSTVFGLYLITTAISMSTVIIVIILSDNPAYTFIKSSLVVLTLPIGLFIIYSGGIFLGKDLISKFNRQKIIPIIGNLIGLIIFLWIFNLGVTGALLSLVLSNMIILIINLQFIIKTYGWFKPHFNFTIISSIVKLGIIYGLALFSIGIGFNINILMLEGYSNASEIGYYSTGSGIAKLLLQIPAALGLVILSKSATTKEADQLVLGKNVHKLLRLALLLSIFCAIILYFIIPVLVPVFYGDPYIPCIPVVQTILPGVIILLIFNILNSRMAGIGKPHYALFAFAPVILLNIILGSILIPRFNSIGAALTSNICWFASVFVFIIIYKYKMNVSLKEIFLIQKNDFDFISKLIKYKYFDYYK